MIEPITLKQWLPVSVIGGIPKYGGWEDTVIDIELAEVRLIRVSQILRLVSLESLSKNKFPRI